ncbi:putative glycosyltransferase [Desulfovibrio sp. X2]|uniref:glycosyltransferase n=1 Tax=Desulfovibrio sp. X2 TaxID=941449 RepID=UPI000358F47B|nr:glycosyltransferase [Desulfovibrio sp. X2]EPR37084.1 putative glycosyltransferase [Desulfovibrio sp. X2]
MRAPLPEPPFSRLPESLREPLLVGAAGAPRLLTLAAGAGSMPELAADLRLAAFEAAPCDAQAAAAALPLLSGTPLAAWAGRCAAARPPVKGLAYFQRLLERREGGKLLDFLAARLEETRKDDPGAPFWMAQAWHFGRFAARADWLGEVLAPLVAAAEGGAGPVSALLAAERALAAGDFAALAGLAAEAMTSGGRSLPWQRPRLLLAEACLRLARREEGLGHLLAALRARPWEARLWAKTHDAATGFDQAVAALPGPLAVCCYTWNKADDLSATLDALLPALPADALLAVLDNGSADETPNVLARAAAALGDRLVSVRLPVNVGAAAARNWLASLPEVRARDFVCYLDDDALLPPDAFGRLGAAVAACPEASTWGCRVVDAAAPHVVQHADLHVAPDGEGLRFSTAHGQEPDWGGLAYLRPCVSVTGCCHLLRSSSLAASGFDIRLSPSQFDDLERDLRQAAAGGFSCYQGHLSVRHMKSAGTAARLGGAAEANARGNRVKLEALHPAEEIARIRDADLQRLEDDLAAKAARLDAILAENGAIA